ncbi:MAG: amidohydrolase family protein, partial [Anaerolineae bacterium]|nr:amidohydrolase family protein [Anaerolineae bacterium]
YTLSNAPKTALGNWEGALITDAALATKMSVPMFIQRLLIETELNATIIAYGGNLADNDRMFRHPAAMLCSDGVMIGGHPHPRGYGAFPHFIADYVREHRIVSLAEAIHKMTGLPAKRLNLQNRGILAKGAAADLVIFSLNRIAAGATFENGRAMPRGIDWVFVNGNAVVAQGAFVDSNAGVAPANRWSC